MVYCCKMLGGGGLEPGIYCSLPAGHKEEHRPPEPVVRPSAATSRAPAATSRAPAATSRAPSPKKPTSMGAGARATKAQQAARRSWLETFKSRATEAEKEAIRREWDGD